MDPALRECALANYYAAERRAGSCPLVACERMAEYAKRLDALHDNVSVAEFDRKLNEIASVALGV